MLEDLLTEIGHIASPDWWRQNALPLFNILMIDLTLAGDNAIVVGMAAARGPSLHARQGHLLGHRRRGRAPDPVLGHRAADAPGDRPHVCGRAAATVRVPGRCTARSSMAVEHNMEQIEGQLASKETSPQRSHLLVGAVDDHHLADVSMSLDNVLAVAGAGG